VKFFPDILENFGFDHDSANSIETRWIFMGILNVLLYPVVYVKDSTALAHFNLLGIMSAFYVIVVLAV
jgi:hypothetical protein